MTRGFGTTGLPGQVARMKQFMEKHLMKKFLYMFLLAAAVASAFSFVLAAEDESMGEKKFVLHGEIRGT
ncbi:MAG: hypothetical protein DMH00_02650 [Acidobacteria bacterium]|nr:MAG: hypothetical protein DMH00_02650 [Acidobacteriota bacterium]